MKTSAEHFQRTAEILRPPQRLRISEWADAFAYIPHEQNEEPGKFQLSRMPHQAAMLDDPLDPNVREIFWMMASQAAGKTCCLNIICEYAVRVLRQSVIMVRATRQTAIDWMRKKFLPMVEETPCMAGVFKNPRQRDSGSTSLSRRFVGGSLEALGAKSPAAFRGTSAGKVFQDEIDTYVAIKEGDPCALADRAAKTFHDAWKIKSSTPTLRGFSRVEEGYLRGDQQKYFLPCPVCGEFQDLKSCQLKFSFTAEEHARTNQPMDYEWELGQFPIFDTRRAVYVCEQCRHGWSDRQRIEAYLSGCRANPPVIVNRKELRAEWRATAPFTGVRSRHLNGLYLTMGLEKGFDNYLQQFAEGFLKAKHGGRETLMVHINLFEALTFEDASQKTDWKEIQKRAEDFVAWVEGYMGRRQATIRLLHF